MTPRLHKNLLPQIPLSILISAITVGVGFHLSLFLLLKIQVPDEPNPVRKPGFIRFEGNSQEESPRVREQALLFDSSPLFMPTRWNYANQFGDVASLQESAQLYEPFPAKLNLPNAQFPLDSFWMSPPHPDQFIPDSASFIMASLGRKPVEPPANQAGSSSYEVMHLPSSKVILRNPLPQSLVESTPDSFWEPLRFYLTIHAGAPVGPPVIVDSSGFPDWDRQVRAFFQDPDFYRFLPDGYFEIRCFP